MIGRYTIAFDIKRRIQNIGKGYGYNYSALFKTLVIWSDVFPLHGICGPNPQDDDPLYPLLIDKKAKLSVYPYLIEGNKLFLHISCISCEKAFVEWKEMSFDTSNRIAIFFNMRMSPC